MIDAIAGGGGLITVPALLFATSSPTIALGTNKGQAVFGSFSALVSYWRGGHVHARRAVPSFIAACAGALLGVRLVLAIDKAAVRPIVLALLVFVALVFAVRGRPSRKASTLIAEARLSVGARHPIPAAATIGFALGAYDGFFGPGTGTFLIALYVAVFGDDLTRATANAKVSNFASNLTSVVVFALAGRIDFRLALPMAAAQLLGGWLGARAAVKGGDRLVRAGVLVVTFALVVRLAWQIATGG